jgi:hypothetical protein
MTRCSSGFRKGNIKKAVEAVKAAGESVARVEVGPDGKVTVTIGKPADSTENSKNEWDQKYGR